VNATEDPPLSASWRTLPWELMITLDEGGPSFELPSHEIVQEAYAYAQAPYVVLFGRTGFRELIVNQITLMERMVTKGSGFTNTMKSKRSRVTWRVSTL
jgi:hypothetical protein